MSLNIPTHFAQQFAMNITLLLQQKNSRLRGKVMEGSHFGKQASPVDQYGLVEMQDVTTRFGEMGRVDAPTERRWVLPTDSDLPQLIDTFDKLRLLTDPSSMYVQNAVQAANRRVDKHIISAFFAAVCMLLWNFIAPTFGGPELSFWTAWAAWILLGFVGGLFKSTFTSKEK